MSVECGGLGWDLVVVLVGVVVDFGDCVGVEDFVEYGEVGVGFWWVVEVLVCGEGFGCRWGWVVDLGVVGSLFVDVCDGDCWVDWLVVFDLDV